MTLPELCKRYVSCLFGGCGPRGGGGGAGACGRCVLVTHHHRHDICHSALISIEFGLCSPPLINIDLQHQRPAAWGTLLIEGETGYQPPGTVRITRYEQGW
jgi:hypothetical protein